MKEKIKMFVKSKVSKLDYAVVVASCGRSGSTMLFKALADSSIRGRKIIPSHWIKSKKWDIEGYKHKGIIYKTHDMPPNKIDERVKYVYVYDDPIRVVSSTMRKARSNLGWWVGHKNHMKSSCEQIEKVAKNDCLGIKQNIIKWYEFCKNNEKGMSVKYNTLWEKGRLRNFLDVDIELPKRKSRKSKIQDLDTSTIKKLINYYDDVYEVTGMKKPKI